MLRLRIRTNRTSNHSDILCTGVRRMLGQSDRPWRCSSSHDRVGVRSLRKVLMVLLLAERGFNWVGPFVK